MYCSAPLATQHEHDHFPTPKRQGGTQTFCVCVNCHALKDRDPLGKWSAAAAFDSMAGLWSKASPAERILLGKMLAIVGDAG